MMTSAEYNDQLSNSTAPANKKKNLLWLWICLAVIAVGGIVVGILFLTGTLGKTPPPEEGGDTHLLKEAVFYYADGSEFYRYTVALNKDNLPESVTINSATMNIVEYDKNGNPISVKDPFSGIASFVKFDEHGNILETTRGAYKTTYKYDQFGNVIYCEYYDSDFASKSTYTYEYTYDNDGHILEEVKFSDGQKDQRSTYKYDEHGNVTENCVYTGAGDVYSAYTYTYKYDGDNMLEQTGFSKGVEYKWVYEYENNNLVKECFYRGEEIRQYAYEYDKNGNIIKMSKFNGDKLDWYITFSYFEKGITLTEAQKKAFEEMYITDTYLYWKKMLS